MKERLQSTISKALPPAAAIVLLILVWQLVCSLGDVPKYMLPSPADVIEAYRKDWQLMLSHSRVTLTETFIGLFGGIAVGFIMAVIMDRFTLVRKTVYPLVVISQTIPTIAIAPLLVLWLGYQMLPKIILIILNGTFGG